MQLSGIRHMFNECSTTNTLENRLTQKGDLEPHMKYFPGAPNGPLRIEDDHVPFMRQG